MDTFVISRCYTEAAIFRILCMDKEPDISTDDADKLGPWGEKVLSWVVRKRLEMPAKLFLEMHRPLQPLLWPAAMMAGGIIAPLFGPDYWKKAESLRDSNVIDRAIKRLGKLSVESG